jgi:hypothetical protein
VRESNISVTFNERKLLSEESGESKSLMEDSLNIYCFVVNIGCEEVVTRPESYRMS